LGPLRHLAEDARTERREPTAEWCSHAAI
jgi:hypothetical protein